MSQSRLNVWVCWLIVFRKDLMSITDELVMETLYNGDATQGKYLDEDPSLQDILVHLENTQ